MRAVLFDVDGVLVKGYHARPESRRRWDEDLLARLGIDPQRFADEFIYDSFVKHVLVGRISLFTALDRLLPRLGYTGDTMSFIDRWLSHDSILDVELMALVGQLSGKANLYLATNQDHMRAQWLWTTLGLGASFDDIFHSARIGALKPTRPYFEGVAKRIGTRADRPLLFDDRLDIVKAARAFGWEAVLYEAIDDVRLHPWIEAQLS